MRIAALAAAVTLAAALCLPSPASAQTSSSVYPSLGDQLKPGDTIWVTDAQGREIKGKIGSLEPGAITLRGGGGRTFNLSELRQVTVRRGDPVANGGTIGMAVGALAGLGAGIAGCAAYPKDDPARGDSCLMAIGLLWMPGLAIGGLAGVGIDAMIHGGKLVVYRGPGPGGTSHARLSISPVIAARTKGLAIALSF